VADDRRRASEADHHRATIAVRRVTADVRDDRAVARRRVVDAAVREVNDVGADVWCFIIDAHLAEQAHETNGIC